MTVNEPTVQVGLQGDQVFQKYIATTARKIREIRFACVDAIYIGFVTGLDREWVQLALTFEGENVTNLERTLVRLENICSVRETGRGIEDLKPLQAEATRKYTSLFRKISNGELPEPSA